jgi:crotonobetainyl-CoA:carnitine CoA-transferase CaiB-like acyl-CoA transferase
VAAPGASQHLAMLAFDVAEFQNPRVGALLARHGWFQTVLSDLPHFTYLGLAERELRSRGLRPVEEGGQKFWVPDIPES